MGIQRYERLNQLQQLLPEGLPVDSSWLQQHGYSRQLIAKYLKSEWLASSVRGVYRRESALIDPQSWEPVAISLQTLLDVPVTVGGRTALELQGLSHYLSSKASGKVHMYGAKPPTWVSKLPLKQQFIFHSANLFEKGNGTNKKQKDYQQVNFTNQQWGASVYSLQMSTPERAILELLDELPANESFHQADVLMEGLTNLRPKYLETLLLNCRSIKTKRLFLWFAQRHNHDWFKTLDSKKIDTGSGKRMIVPGGKLDPKYLITVPVEFADDVQRTI